MVGGNVGSGVSEAMGDSVTGKEMVQLITCWMCSETTFLGEMQEGISDLFGRRAPATHPDIDIANYHIVIIVHPERFEALFRC
jgi:hypothetical protein